MIQHEPIVYTGPYDDGDLHNPQVVDSILPMMQAYKNSGDPKIGRALEQALQHNEVAVRYSKELGVLCGQYGVKYAFVVDGCIAVDASPGQNTVNLYPEFIDPQAENALLNEHLAGCRYPDQQTAFDYSVEPAITGPSVVKDKKTSRGINKLLVLPDEAEKVKKHLGTIPKYLLDGILVERYIETPGDYSSSFRFDMNPAGDIFAATLKISNDKSGEEVDGMSLLQGSVFSGLADLIPSRGLVTQSLHGGTSYPLLVDKEVHSPKRINNDGHAGIFDAYGIGGSEMRLPDKLRKIAIGIARTLGPSYGMIFGIDVMVDTLGKVWLAEINNSPGLNDTRLSMGPGWTNEELYALSAQKTIAAMADWPR